MLHEVCFVAAAGQYGMGCRRARRQDPIPISPKGGSLSGRAAGYLSPSLACARPPAPPQGGSCVYPSCVHFFSRFLA